MDVVIGLLFMVSPFILGIFLFKSYKHRKKLILDLEVKAKENEVLINKYKDIIDLDKYKEEAKKEKDKLELLKSEIVILDQEKILQEHGMYEVIFDLEDSGVYKDRIYSNKENQKDMISTKTAATCSTEWNVEGSAAKGRKLTNDNIKLTLRAFNGECDVSISKVKYNNVVAMKKKIEKAYESINKAMNSNHIRISERYLKLKLDELHLTHELREKQYEEKEEQKSIREQIREEEKAQKELEKAQQKAETEENRYQEALEKARIEVEQATGSKHEKMLENIKKLEAQLLEAQENKQRAISRAQMTRSGHVYVISNIGSFGEDIYKIGMTRRLEPLDRVKELGDASVPFLFDVHAMIFSEDAPTLEKELHKIFADKRVNMVNERREFFNVTLGEIQNIVEENHGKIEFTKLAEAKEYRETISIKEAKKLVS